MQSYIKRYVKLANVSNQQFAKSQSDFSFSPQKLLVLENFAETPN